jgi:hypothetical protein
MESSFLRNCVRSFAATFGEAWRDAAHSSQLLSEIRRISYDHGTINTLVDVKGVSTSSSMEAMTAAFALPNEIIERGDVLEFQRVLDKGVLELRKQASEMFFKKLGEAAESVGNVLDTGGQPLTGRFLCDLFERIEIEFDQQGRARMPTIVCPPDKREQVRELLEDPAVQIRLDVILREKWLARYALK